ncbi:Acetyltransferase (GNAT) family [Halanaeroarchaeum sp. HSR-CO]|uniref:hypothetical protein n=1 Tax=Halanaeroarchaeum sp. HSR-CO TaxID=2866382 RepID=UPI00217E6F04|nr:hypothetical protein [Halanaeroarchaeum sp. HSR-CO]UWG48793.1 Acetyltransferase (GNAT) family [Halanaeroarchaeum sp. HSR-CO]
MNIRQARHEDGDAIGAFTRDTWAEYGAAAWTDAVAAAALLAAVARDVAIVGAKRIRVLIPETTGRSATSRRTAST